MLLLLLTKETLFLAMPNFLSEQGSSTGGGWQAAAVQREPEKEEGAEGEKAAEEGR